MSAASRKAIGIVRVSETKGREGPSFASPAEQRGRIEDECERRRLELIEVVEELDMPGRTPLAKRPGLSRAIEAVESGEASVVVAAYFDRLMRSLRFQEELVSRVEAAGGQVLALDFGEVSGRTASQWLSSSMLGLVAEYHARSAAERSHEAQQMAIDRGVAPWPNTSPGYVRDENGVHQPHAAERGTVLVQVAAERVHCGMVSDAPGIRPARGGVGPAQPRVRDRQGGRGTRRRCLDALEFNANSVRDISRHRLQPVQTCARAAQLHAGLDDGRRTPQGPARRRARIAAARE